MPSHCWLLLLLGLVGCGLTSEAERKIPIDFIEQSLHTKDAITDIWGSGPGDVYAVGRDGTIAHSNGAYFDWEVQAKLATLRFVGIWGSGPADVYAAAWDGVILHSRGDGAWVPVFEVAQT